MELKCKTLIFVGESSPFLPESVYMNTMIGQKNSAFVEVMPWFLFPEY